MPTLMGDFRPKDKNKNNKIKKIRFKLKVVNQNYNGPRKKGLTSLGQTSMLSLIKYLMKHAHTRACPNSREGAWPRILVEVDPNKIPNEA